MMLTNLISDHTHESCRVETMLSCVKKVYGLSVRRKQKKDFWHDDGFNRPSLGSINAVLFSRIGYH